MADPRSPIVTAETKDTKSILQLADEEARNVQRHLQLLGDTYELISSIEALYDTMPSHCGIPLNVATNDASHTAVINANLLLICRRDASPRGTPQIRPMRDT